MKLFRVMLKYIYTDIISVDMMLAHCEELSQLSTVAYFVDPSIAQVYQLGTRLEQLCKNVR